MRSPFNYTGGEFSLPAIEATAGGGPVTGSFQLSPNGKHSLFTAQAKFEGVDAARLAADAGSSAEQITGVLRGAVEVRGSSREVARMEGTGRLEAANGQFRRLELLQTIGHVLQIEELANLHLKQGQADFHIADEKVFIDTLVLDSPDLRLSGQGYVRLDGKVSLDAQLAMDARDLNRSPSIVRNLFKPTETSGQSAVDFKVFGKLSNLKTDLAEKVIGKTIGDQFESFVSGLFGTKKKKNDKKKEDKKRKVEEETQSIPVPPSGEAPSPSPAGRPVPGPPSSAAPSANSGAARSGAHLAARGG